MRLRVHLPFLDTPKIILVHCHTHSLFPSKKADLSQSALCPKANHASASTVSELYLFTMNINATQRANQYLHA